MSYGLGWKQGFQSMSTKRSQKRVQCVPAPPCLQSNPSSFNSFDDGLIMINFRNGKIFSFGLRTSPWGGSWRVILLGV